MQSIEKRVSALEATRDKSLYHLSDAELEAVIDEAFVKAGTTLAQEIAKYGSLHALLKALRDDIQAIQSKTISKVNKHDNN